MMLTPEPKWAVMPTLRGNGRCVPPDIREIAQQVNLWRRRRDYLADWFSRRGLDRHIVARMKNGSCDPFEILRDASPEGVALNTTDAVWDYFFNHILTEPDQAGYLRGDVEDRKPVQPAAAASVSFSATQFVWRDPLTIPPRPWVYGRHMIRKQVSVTVAPGGVGKSSLTLVEGLAMVTGRELLGEWVPRSALRVWVYNLEDPRDEMERRVIGAMIHHQIAPDAIGDRLFIDTGRERALCTAIEVKGDVTIVKPEIDALAAEIMARGIDVFIIDPFVSSHRVGENASGAIDLVAKEWARLADRCNCAIELVHHTRKTNGAEATTEDGRGSTALLAAARSGRVLNRMADDLKEEAGVLNDPATYFAITRDKANLAPAGKRKWVRMASVDLGQGDSVGVAEAWEWPDTFDDMGVADLLRVQQAIEGKQPRYSDQAGEEWVGVIVAQVLGLDASADRKRIKRMIETWLKSGALVKGIVEDSKRNKRPCVEVGEWVSE